MEQISRRHFVTAIAAGLAGAALPDWAAAAPSGAGNLSLPPGARSVSFRHLHTGERLAVEYFTNGAYLPDALQAVDRILRDFRTDEIHAIDPALLDLLHALTRLSGSRRPFEVISGYRSPATNRMLRSRSERVAAGSLHMRGKAIDIRLADVPLAALRKAALEAGGGGVGYYPASNFVHVDTGRVRFW